MNRSIALTSLLLVPGLLQPVNRTIAAGTFDGTYAGNKIETQNNKQNGNCDGVQRNNTQIVVKDSVLKYQWGPVPLETTMGGDGSFSVFGPAVTVPFLRGILLKGNIRGGNLEADVGNNLCAAHLSFKKI